jgi:hypothetical protein
VEKSLNLLLWKGSVRIDVPEIRTIVRCIIVKRMGSRFSVSPDRVKRAALLAAIIGMILFGIAGYHALSNEITGTAIYHKGARIVTSEPVPGKLRRPNFVRPPIHYGI